MRLLSLPRGAALVALLAASTTRAPAQGFGPRDSVPPGRTSSILRLPGKTVEVIGLRRWTIPMLQDSLAKYAPGETLDSHACAATLRYKLGFADAAATLYMSDAAPRAGDSLERIVVAVVEPQDSARVRSRPAPFDTTHPYAPWSEGIALIARHPMAVQGAQGYYLEWRRAPAAPLPEWLARDSASLRRYMRFIAAHRGADDKAAALRLLATSPDYRTRVAATSVLLNFIDDDEAVFALVGAMLERDGIVKGFAGGALESFARSTPRAVRWERGAPMVHALLDGTSLFQLSSTMRLLVATGASPSHARPFLRDGGNALLDFLGAEQLGVRSDAHRLLVALKGEDLGLDPAPWRAWIASL